MVAKSKKVAYFAHLEEALNKYQRAFIVQADFVGSKQISDIRIALRGKCELIFGKNTMIRRCIRNLNADGSHPEWMEICDVMKGNLGFMFTNGDLGELEEVVNEFVKPAGAKAGVIAPLSCTIPKGPTGLDPAQTSFFQALNIATKINKGSIEIINDCEVIKAGSKVGSSEAALLTKMGIKPFKYGLVIQHVYEGGVFDPSVLKIKDEDLIEKFGTAVGCVAALSLAIGLPTEASFPHLVVGAAKDITAVAVEAEYFEFAAPGGPASLWPEAQLPAATYRLGGAAGPQLDLFVWLGWDTDHTDVDLHVKEPTGEEVYYSHNRSATTGAHVSRDFTDGYGPEVYTLPSAPKGTYSVDTNYFASHRESSRTGSTSAVVWSIKNMGKWETEQVQFSSVRLSGHKQRQQVLSIEC